MQHPVKILEQYWNFTEFRPFQEDAIQAALDGEDVFVLMPTGGGKSMCFQIPALAKEGICIVISPLVALMKNQVQVLQDKGIKAMALTSGLSYSQLDTMLDNCIYGKYKFLYISPERLQQELVQERIRQMNVNLIAIDEAHCISQWGNDFRPAYKNITILRELHPMVNCMALTASATPLVVEDIVTELDFLKPKIFKQSFFRPNLAYMVFHEDDKYYRIETILRKYSNSSIIYVRSRKLTLEIANFLEKKGIKASSFHGGLSNAEKDERLNDWLANKMQVMVATNAFGMGIDKPDVKTVIHLNLPESLESYFQEAGRAGRNGEKAFAVILKNKSDDELVKNQFLDVLPSIDFIKQVYRKLSNFCQISYGEGALTTHDFNFNQFCKAYKFNGVLAYNALQILDRTSIITLTKQFQNKTLVQFVISNAALFHYLDTHTELQLIVKSLLRTYGGIFEHATKINTTLVSEKASIQEQVLMRALNTLEKDEIIVLQQTKTDAQVTFIEPREDDKTINRIANVIEQQNSLKRKQVQSVLDYVDNDSVCKTIQLLNYFGEKDVKPCGVCSVCIGAVKTLKKPNPIDFTVLRKQIIMHLEHGDLTSRALASAVNCTEADVLSVLKLLLEHQIISITKTNTYKLYHT
ncbi:ATP-dependent DNA helicase, RecQ family [Formosa agariphila KMM 3901]|uniref:ATP-dependent DNA helicase RecQ n=1 Tax=Formosa agariphila (strain DSM 15362 / KCTC 12365 / LMG 23005 / KMM 3901 / M-2Alg 35-1) TaxID=1347342 RepID=T2KKC2_FORAG|nr:RecQ family ATP-dependent DNA helicase [Formosa agariphila]CDF78861.1 ATP-dependent DNA helicase, RecQ family [Formosa agariphila KMM 3901]